MSVLAKFFLEDCHIFQAAVRDFYYILSNPDVPQKLALKYLSFFFPSTDSEGSLSLFFFHFQVAKVYFLSRALLFQEILKVFDMTVQFER